MRLIFIRHGDPDYENDTLTEKGWREAELLSERVIQWENTDFYCSPLGRAQDTASVSLKKLDRHACTFNWLQEFPAAIEYPKPKDEHIPWDMMPGDWTKNKELYDKDMWDKTPLMKTGPVEQCYNTIKKGMDNLLSAYGYEREGSIYHTRASLKKKEERTVVLFCHLGVTLAALSYLLGISAPVLWHGFFLAPTSVTILNPEEIVPGEAYFRCQVLGDTRHLSEGGEPISTAGYFGDLFQG